jgi:hypothetical protein
MAAEWNEDGEQYRVILNDELAATVTDQDAACDFYTENACSTAALNQPCTTGGAATSRPGQRSSGVLRRWLVSSFGRARIAARAQSRSGVAYGRLARTRPDAAVARCVQCTWPPMTHRPGVFENDARTQ